MEYAAFKALRDELETKLSAASAALSDIRNRKAIELGISPFGPMGLVPDAIKFSAEYRAASYRADQYSQALRHLNQKYAKRFNREIRADIDAKRKARLAERQSMPCV